MTQPREEAARLSPATLAPVLEALADGVVMFDAADRVVAWNARYELLFPHLAGFLRPGVRADEITAYVLKSAKSGDDAAEPGWVERRLAAHANPGQSFLQRVNGRIIESTTRRFTDGGQLVTHRDITDQRHALEALQESERRIDRVLTTSNTAIWEFNSITGQTEFHGSLAHLFDKMPHPVAGKHSLLHLVHPQEQQIVADLLKHSITRGEPAALRCRLNRAHGEERWVQFAFEPKMDASGKPCGSRGFVTDITDTVLTERQLVEQAAQLDAERQKFSDLLELSSDWYWEADADLRLIDISDNFAKATELSRDAILGVRLDLFEKSDQHPQHSDGWRVDLRSRRDVRDMYVMTAPDAQGRRYYFRIAGRPVLQNGTFIGYRGTATDITQGLARANAARQGQKLQALGTMAAGLAHEFNNILAIVLGYAESLRNDLQGKDDLTQQLEQIIDAGNRGAGLSRSLLAFGRSSDKQTRETLNARALVGDLPKLLKPLLGPNFQLSVSTGADAIWLNADRSLLTQCAVNLVVNARDAMPNGGAIALTLSQEPRNSARIQRMGLKPDRDYAAICVSDTGIGMDRATLDRLFEPFFTTKKVGKGTGLGLSLVFSVLKDHEGAVHVDSAPNAGTTFHLLLPVTTAPAASAARTDAARTSGAGFAGLHALLVDDEPQLLALFEKMLKSLGITVTAYSDIDDALAFLDDDSNRIDVLVSDVLMPKMSGFRFAELAQTLREDLDVLFVTGQPERIGEDNPAPAGAHILRKPFTPDQLSQALAKALRTREAA